MKMKFPLILLIFFASFLRIQCQTADFSGKIDSLAALISSDGNPGGVIGVVKDNKVLYKRHFGSASLEFGIPVTDTTVFNLASVSKQFTATLAFILEKEGKLNLDDDIQKYFPELNKFGSPVTIRELIHHTSGIPSTDNIRLFAGLSLVAQWDAEDEFELIKSYQKLNFKPNEEYIYSNTGYFLLARIIEKASGMSFSQCMEEKIFRPFKMKNAAVYDSPGKIISNRASGYTKSGDVYLKSNTDAESIYGSTNVYASLNDMVRWSVNLLSNSPGGKELAEKLFICSDTLNNGDTIHYTGGFNIENYRGVKRAEHSGGTSGFRSQIMFFPGAGFAIFVLSNDETSEPWKIARQISDICLRDNLLPETGREHKEIAVNPDLYDIYKGSYQMPDGMVLKFDRVNDTLKLIIPGAPEFTMFPEKENEFFLKDFDAQCTFIRDSSGMVNEIIWHQGEQNPKGIRYTEPQPLTREELESFTGNYMIPELNVTYPVTVKDNELSILLPKSFRVVNIDQSMKIRYVGNDRFFGSLALVEFKRNADGEITGFVIADVGRLRNIEFKKVAD